MLKLRITGIKDNTYDIELDAPSDNLSKNFKEFFGQIYLKGKLTKLGKRFTFKGNAKCKAKLICDISAEEYIEEISAEINLFLIINTELYFLQNQSNQSLDMDMEIALHEADDFFDMTKIVYDELALSLPIKCISPKYKGKNFEECFPQYSSKNIRIKGGQDRWNVLKDLHVS